MDVASFGSEIFRKLLEAAPDGVVVVGAAGEMVLVNLQTERLFGYPRSALLGQQLELLVPERMRRAHVGHREGFDHAPKIRSMGSGLALFGRRRDGTEFPIEISLSPLIVDGARLTSASIRDVTEAKKSELNVRRIQTHLLSAVESIPVAFAIFDLDDRLMVCNGQFRSLLGRDLSSEIVGQRFDGLLDLNLAAGTFELKGESAAVFRTRLLDYHRKPAGAFDLQSRDGRSLRLVARHTGRAAGTVVTVTDLTT